MVDLSADYRTVDIAEEVQLIRRTNERDYYYDPPKAYRGELTSKEQMASAGVYARLEAAYDVPIDPSDDSFAEYSWKPGDTLTDSLGNVLNIYSASRDAGWWRFLVYDPIIAHDLRHTIDVYDLDIDKDAAGASSYVTEMIKYSAIPCRVQWTDERPQAHAGKHGMYRRATIYLGQRLYLANNSLIRWTDPVDKKMHYFDYISTQFADRLDQLQEISVESRP